MAKYWTVRCHACGIEYDQQTAHDAPSCCGHCGERRRFTVIDRTPPTQADIETEHRALIHPDGGSCPDGCGGDI